MREIFREQKQKVVKLILTEVNRQRANLCERQRERRRRRERERVRRTRQISCVRITAMHEKEKKKKKLRINRQELTLNFYLCKDRIPNDISPKIFYSKCTKRQVVTLRSSLLLTISFEITKTLQPHTNITNRN